MPASKSPAAVIFDMDGVLVHSTPLHDRAYRAVLAAFGINEFDYRPFAGRKTLDSIRILNQQHSLGLDEDGLRNLAGKKTSLALAMLQSENPVAQGALELLQQLDGRLPLALASSASPVSIRAFLDANAFGRFFSVVLSSADVHHAKPSPEIYTEACRRLAVPAARAVVIEDATAGVAAGRAAGARVLGVTGTCPAADLLAAGAEHCVERLIDLLPLILPAAETAQTLD